MHLVEHEIAKPTLEAQFEDMCANVYGEVFGDPLPQNNGRRGQEQAGVDIFVRGPKGRLGIQCKRYQDGKLKLRHIQEEVERADRDGTPIVRLIVATTAANDAKLLREVQQLSDAREAENKFPVDVQFWSEICRHIRRHPKLQRDYDPSAPGGAFEQLRQDSREVRTAVERVEARMQANADQAVPGARPESLNRVVSGQLDRISDLLKAVKYEDAKKEISRIGVDLQVFDEHQKARWYLQRGLCAWHLNSEEAAAADFLKAYELYPDDDKIAAARIRGLLLSGNKKQAVAEGARLLERFPQSVHLWLAHANARLMAGERIEFDEVPDDFRNQADALQMVSMGLHSAGNTVAAVELSQRALRLPDAGFYVRLSAMALALQDALTDPVKAMHGLLAPATIDALSNCTSAFEPWGEKLLDVQAGPAREEGVCNLGYALLLTGNKARARELLRLAKTRGMVSARVLRVELDVLRELGERQELLALADEHAEVLDDDSLLLACEVGANSGRKDLVSRLRGIYASRHAEGGPHRHIMRALDWVVRWKVGERDEVLGDIRAAKLEAGSNIEPILAAARILKDAGAGDEATTLALRAASLLVADSHRMDRLAIAELLFEVGEYAKAAALFQDFVTPGQLSDLHTRLLDAYLRSGQPRKAKNLLQSFPADWAENDVARNLAIRLGQDAGDWDFVQPLADKQRERFPGRASSWAFSLAVALRSGKMLQFNQLLAQVPAELEGTLEQKGQIANTEVRHGRLSQGQQRVYRMFRENLDDADAAAKYMVGLVSALEPVPNMEESLERIAAGTSVRLTDEFGAQVTFTLDPAEVANLPLRGEFVSANSPDAQVLLGHAVGDAVDLPAGMGRTRRMTVQTISSAYRRLMQLAHECMDKSLKPAKDVLQMSVRTSPTGADFSEMQEMLQRQTQHGKFAFESYAKSPLTLSMLARLLGVNVIDMVVSWPLRDTPALFVCQGTVDEMQQADSLLARADGTYVVDALTLAELVNLECEEVLAYLPKIYATTETRDVLRSRLDEALNDKSVGRAIDADGGLGFLPDSDKDKARRVAFFKRMLQALEDHCEVVPAYGPENLPDDFRRFRDVLEAEEYAVLLLTTEREATLLTLDGRLATLAAAGLSLQRVWPHAVIHAAAIRAALPEAKFSTATLKSFIWNRSFTPVRATELVDLCHYGGPFMQTGLQRFKAMVSSETTDFESIVQVTLTFLQAIPSRSISLAAYGELVEHLCEAALRHPRCEPQALVETFAQLLGAVVESSEKGLQRYPQLSQVREHRLNTKGEFLQNSIRNALEFAAKPVVERPFRLKVLKCTRRPSILLDRPQKADAGVAVEPTQQIQSEQGEAPSPETSVSTALLATNPELVKPTLDAPTVADGS